MTCMTPRALAAETIALLKPLSCQAIALASEAGTPLAAATDWTAEAPTRGGGGSGGGLGGTRAAGVGSGAALGMTRVAGAGCAARTGAGAPVGSLMTVPASSTPLGFSPFMAAIAPTDTCELAARPDRRAPGRKV